MTQRPVDKLRKLVLELPKALTSEKENKDAGLSPVERQLLRMLRTESEKASKGRAVRVHESGGENTEQGVVLSAAFEGWHARGVALQVAKSFRRMKDVESADVRDENGKRCVVVVKPRSEVKAS